MISAGASTMLLTRKASSKYSLLPDSDSPAQTTEKPLRSRLLRSSYALTGFLLISSILVLVVLLTPKPRSTCTQPRLRQEWRTLSHDERQSYLAAARCLTRVPSSSLPNATIHDEFSLIHSRVGNYCMSTQYLYFLLYSNLYCPAHDAAPFLPWHRFFIHAYEAALQKHCQYDGITPCVSPVDVQHVTVPANQAPRYWDWSLDYQNLLKSPIWSTDEGFGPDGDKGTSSNMNPNPNPSTSVNGHCVVDGPFAGLTPVYYDGEYQPHCLSRGFLDEETVKKVGNLTMRPSVLQELVRNESSYFDFLLRVETMSHLTIPYVVQGDFRTVTAPNGEFPSP